MFTKMLLLNFEEGNFKPQYWHRIDKITKQKVLLKADSPDVKKHLKDWDVVITMGAGDVWKVSEML